MTDAQQLLADYANNGSETAFRELVARYLNFVYSTALRLVNGNSQLAEDVAQTVFIALAQKAKAFSPGVMLGGWLHQHTFHVATKALRAERRRHNRENEAAQMNALENDSANDWRHVAPILDEAITQLGAEDRAAILLRFFEQSDFRAIGTAMGSSEDAARMRVNRALEKLHLILKQRGATLSVAALGGILASEAVSAAPIGLAAGIASAALAGVPAGGAALATTIKLVSMTKLQMGAIGIFLAAAIAVPAVMKHQANAALREKDDALRQQNGQLAALSAENQRLSNQIVGIKDAQALSKRQLDELLKLRSQVGSLKKQLAEIPKAQPAPAVPQQQQPADTTPDPEEQRQLALRRMDNAKHWLLAFLMYAGDNQGQFPADFAHSSQYISQDQNLSEDQKNEMLGATNQFEMLYTGPMNAITNAGETIVLREVNPDPAVNNGWTKTYGFADGHVEIHRSDTGDFQSYEAQHFFVPPSQ